MYYEDAPPYNKVKTPSYLTLAFAIVLIVLRNVYWVVAHLSQHSLLVVGTLSIIGWGIVIPTVVLILSAIGSRNYQEADYLTLIFGIAIVVLSAIAIWQTAVRLYGNIIGLINNLSLIGLFYVVFVGCIAVCFIMQILCLVGGIKLIQHYSNELH